MWYSKDTKGNHATTHRKGVLTMCSFEDYKDEILSDVLEHARYNAGNFETLDDFRSDCFICDAVTGNASGSYNEIQSTFKN